MKKNRNKNNLKNSTERTFKNRFVDSALEVIKKIYSEEPARSSNELKKIALQ